MVARKDDKIEFDVWRDNYRSLRGGVYVRFTPELVEYRSIAATGQRSAWKEVDWNDKDMRDMKVTSVLRCVTAFGALVCMYSTGAVCSIACWVHAL